MASEVLAVPEECLMDVIKVIRAGMGALGVLEGYLHPEVIENLTKWCDEEEEYLNSLSKED